MLKIKHLRGLQMAGEAREPRVSERGRYLGFSSAIYNGSERRSDYLALAGGVRLAYDLILPTKNHVPATELLPVLFKYTPYLRTFTVFDASGRNILAELFDMGWKARAWLRLRYWLSSRGRVMDPLMRTPWLELLLKHGYAVIVVERPGTAHHLADPTRPSMPRQKRPTRLSTGSPHSRGATEKWGCTETRGKAKSNSRPRAPIAI